MNDEFDSRNTMVYYHTTMVGFDYGLINVWLLQYIILWQLLWLINVNFHNTTVDGCEILHHQKDGWTPQNNGINNHLDSLVQDFATIHCISILIICIILADPSSNRLAVRSVVPAQVKCEWTWSETPAPASSTRTAMQKKRDGDGKIQKSLGKSIGIVNGLVQGKIYRKPSIFPLNMGFSCKFSLKPIHWDWKIQSQLMFNRWIKMFFEIFSFRRKMEMKWLKLQFCLRGWRHLETSTCVDDSFGSVFVNGISTGNGSYFWGIVVMLLPGDSSNKWESNANILPIFFTVISLWSKEV